MQPNTPTLTRVVGVLLVCATGVVGSFGCRRKPAGGPSAVATPPPTTAPKPATVPTTTAVTSSPEGRPRPEPPPAARLVLPAQCRVIADTAFLRRDDGNADGGGGDDVAYDLIRAGTAVTVLRVGANLSLVRTADGTEGHVPTRRLDLPRLPPQQARKGTPPDNTAGHGRATFPSRETNRGGAAVPPSTRRAAD